MEPDCSTFGRETSLRLFVAIIPPPWVCDLLLDAQLDTPDLRQVDHDKLHLTLRFLGEVDGHTADDVATALAAVHGERFDLQLSGVGTFDRPKGGAVWAGVTPDDAVRRLAGKIERACLQAGLPPERRVFHPHITIARWNGRTPPAGAAALIARLGDFRSPPFPVDDFHLVESQLSRHGAQHDIVGTYRLG